MALYRFTLQSSPQMTAKVQGSYFKLKWVSKHVFTNVLKVKVLCCKHFSLLWILYVAIIYCMWCHLQIVNLSSDVNRRINDFVWNLKTSSFTTAIRPKHWRRWELFLCPSLPDCVWSASFGSDVRVRETIWMHLLVIISCKWDMMWDQRVRDNHRHTH